MKAKRVPAKNNPGRTKKLSIKWLAVMSIALFFVGGVLFLNYKEGRRHRLVDVSINELRATLEQNGFIDIEKSSGCGRTQVKYGDGAKVCSISLQVSSSFKNEEEANFVLSNFSKVLSSNTAYSTVQALRKTVKSPDGGLGIAYGHFSHKKTGTNCSASSLFDEEKLNLRLTFTCDDSSWFTRTFETGRFSI